MSTIKSLSIVNFMAFSNAVFEFSPGINVFIGENSTGKTQTLKLIYAITKIASADLNVPAGIGQTIPRFQGVFNLKNTGDLVRRQQDDLTDHFEKQSNIVLWFDSSSIEVTLW